MARLRAVFLFKANGIFVCHDLLGRSLQADVRSYSVEFTIPRSRDDFLTWSPRGDYEAIGVPSAGTGENPNQFVSIYVIRAVAEFDSDIDLVAVNERQERASKDRAFEVLREAERVVATVYRSLLEWITSRKQQRWLGLSTQRVETVHPWSLHDVASGQRLRVSTSGVSAVRMLSGTSALDSETLGLIWADVITERRPPPGELLLSDAVHFAWGTDDDVDPVRATLMAAIACEIKAKSTLQSNVAPERRSIIDYVLDNHNLVSVAAVDGLFDKLPQAAIGRSLRLEDKACFRELKNLFESRNKLVHEGTRPTADEAKVFVKTARKAFEWLDGIHEAQ